ncbi:hypothetical protein C900_04451 [Fulvivirga imtechensis AK7]|uniref:Uncharacterized protein n=1 Tax=Fulvivirga imtechensis AK7 TaxID=1237149 RepID=L8JP10_9BACT|nr:hypothetical protein C900_04451 [Fulvivirga imtechensis AK7]
MDSATEPIRITVDRLTSIISGMKFIKLKIAFLNKLQSYNLEL